MTTKVTAKEGETTTALLWSQIADEDRRHLAPGLSLVLSSLELN